MNTKCFEALIFVPILFFLFFFLQALTIHFQSYVDKMTIVLAVDPKVIPDPEQLLEDLEESLKLIREAAVKQGLKKETA